MTSVNRPTISSVSRELVPTGKAIVSTPTGQGYWVLEVGLSGAGSVLPFGDADFFGDTVTILQQTMVEFHGEPVGLVATPSGQGYWEVYSDGGVFGFGDAGFFGSTGGIHLNKPIVGMAATPTGNGYWLVASDGGVFAFGDAVFFGSTGAIHLNKPIVGMARTRPARATGSSPPTAGSSRSVAHRSSVRWAARRWPVRSRASRAWADRYHPGPNAAARDTRRPCSIRSD